MARIAEDNDFDNLKKLVDEFDGWILELDKADTKVWTRPIDGCSFQMVKIQTVFPEISSETLYDVLHDPDYRRVWDTHMLESLDIGMLNVNNDVGYYASKRLFLVLNGHPSGSFITSLLSRYSVVPTPIKTERFCTSKKLA